MKLYATTTSERASKGQGGQKFIEVLVNDEQGKNLVKLYVEMREDEIYTEVLHYSNGEKLLFSDQLQKGKKQKDDISPMMKCNNHTGWCAEHQTRHE